MGNHESNHARAEQRTNHASTTTITHPETCRSHNHGSAHGKHGAGNHATGPFL